MDRLHRFVLGFLALSVPGCTATQTENRFTVSDSAGIGIATSSGPSWAEDEGWTIDPVALLEVGEESGEEPYLFSGIAGALRLPDTGVVVADRRSRELRYFDARGEFLFSAGGEGDGPGEFSSLQALARCGGDTIYAFDVQHRARLFTESGQWIRTLPLIMGPGGGPPQSLSCGSPGRFLIMGWDPAQLQRMRSGHRFEPPMRLYDEQGSVVADLGTFPGPRYVSFPGGSALHEYSHHIGHALGPDRAVIGTGDSYELRIYDLSGTLRSILRWVGADLTFTDEDLVRHRQRRLAGTSGDRRREVEQELRDWMRPESWPAYRSLRMDPDGNIWVEHYDRRRDATAAPEWMVLSAAGRMLGNVTLPARFTITEIGRDYVVGVSKDALDVERVVVHRVLKTSR